MIMIELKAIGGGTMTECITSQKSKYLYSVALP